MDIKQFIRNMYVRLIRIPIVALLNVSRMFLFDLSNKGHKKYYRYIDKNELLAAKKSDTVFIFGCGYSLNSITEKEFRFFEKHNTLSFNLFLYQDFLPIDYHLMREITQFGDVFLMNKYIDDIYSCMKKKLFAQTIYLLQSDWRSTTCVDLLTRYIFPPHSRIWLYKTYSRRRMAKVHSDLNKGLIHNVGTLSDSIHFAYAMGFKHIVLVGVDLYDRRYFWLDYDETLYEDRLRGASNTDAHNTSHRIIDIIKTWDGLFKKDGVFMYIYNPNSLLREVLPVYTIPDHESGR